MLTVELLNVANVEIVYVYSGSSRKVDLDYSICLPVSLCKLCNRDLITVLNLYVLLD